jgi:hypothetical protein
MAEVEEDGVDQLASLLKPGSRVVTSDLLGKNPSDPMVIVDADEYDALVTRADKAEAALKQIIEEDCSPQAAGIARAALRESS